MFFLYNRGSGSGVTQHGVALPTINEEADVINNGGGTQNDNQNIDELPLKAETHAFFSVWKECRLAKRSSFILIYFSNVVRFIPVLIAWELNMPFNCHAIFRGYPAKRALPAMRK